MKAIETRWNGYRFRSRTEARWAVFLHTLGIRFEYEKEGYVVGGKPYLPDFWLPDQQCFLEVKPVQPASEEEELYKSLARQSGFDVYVLFGDVWMPPAYLNDPPQNGALKFGKGGGRWSRCAWAQCTRCQKYFIIYRRYEHELPCDCPHETDSTIEDYDTGEIRSGIVVLPESDTLIDAFQAARSARFEHGEKPGTDRG